MIDGIGEKYTKSKKASKKLDAFFYAFFSIRKIIASQPMATVTNSYKKMHYL